jgi:hypothetical protein
MGFYIQAKCLEGNMKQIAIMVDTYLADDDKMKDLDAIDRYVWIAILQINAMGKYKGIIPRGEIIPEKLMKFCNITRELGGVKKTASSMRKIIESGAMKRVDGYFIIMKHNDWQIADVYKNKKIDAIFGVNKEEQTLDIDSFLKRYTRKFFGLEVSGNDVLCLDHNGKKIFGTLTAVLNRFPESMYKKAWEMSFKFGREQLGEGFNKRHVCRKLLYIIKVAESKAPQHKAKSPTTLGNLF